MWLESRSMFEIEHLQLGYRRGVNIKLPLYRNQTLFFIVFCKVQCTVRTLINATWARTYVLHKN